MVDQTHFEVDRVPTDSKAFVRQAHFAQSGRLGWGHLLRHLEWRANHQILLPSYIGFSPNEGSGIMDPVIEQDRSFVFCKVNSDLSLDIDHFKEIMQTGRVRIAMVIHYFGFCQSDLHAIRDLCDRYDSLLIEDCCHSLCSRIPDGLLGDFGDFSMFSVHKFLPTSDGGILKVNTGNVNLPPLSVDQLMPFETLELLHLTDLQRVSEVRRRNYLDLAAAIEDVHGLRLMSPDLPQGIVPMNLPILIGDDRRYEVYQKLIERGVRPVALYYELAHQIDREEFTVAAAVSNQILNLPIHQDVTSEQIPFIAEAIRDALKAS